MEKVERIENFLKEWKDENNETKNYYIRYREWVNPDGNVEEMDFFDELENLLTNLNIKYKYTNVGYFEMAGYYLTYDCLSVISKENDIYTFPIITEIY